MSMTALVIASIIGSLAAAGAGIAGSAMNYQAQKDTNAANIAMQNQTNQMAMGMSNTAHQREMEDLKRAGLNPVLTATGGSGSPVASISSPKQQAPQIDMSSIGSAITGTVQSLTNLKMAEMIGERYKDINADKIAADANLKGNKSEYYRQMANRLRMASNGAASGAIFSPKQFSQESQYDGMSKKELKKLWEELLK